MTDLRDHNERLLRQVYDGLEGRTVAPIAAALHPEVVLHVNGAGELDGTHSGRDAVVAFYHFEDGLISEIWIRHWDGPAGA